MTGPPERRRPAEGPLKDADDLPTEAEREQLVSQIVGAVDDGVLDPEDGGRRLSAAYRAGNRRTPRSLARGLASDRSAARFSESRRVRWWAVARIVLYALASATMVVAVLHGVSPSDHH